MIEIEAPEKEPLLFGKTPGDGVGVSLRDVSKTYLRQGLPLDVLADVTVHVGPMEVLGIVGPSGCGKSTLLELACGLQEPSSGELAIDGRRTARERLAQCALMPQRDLLLPWRSALDNASLPLELGGLERASARSADRPALRAVRARRVRAHAAT